MSFHRQAPAYDLHASVQKRVVSRLMQYVKDSTLHEPASVLDIGCGTGLLLSSLQHHFPNTQLNGLDLALNMISRSRERLGSTANLVVADAERLPFRQGEFDLVVSTSTLQWLECFDMFFQGCYRIMNPESLLCIAFFGGKTLWELRECFREAVERFSDKPVGMLRRLHTFKALSDVKDALDKTDFDAVILTSDLETEYHLDVFDLLRSIKSIGAGVHKKSGGGLGWRTILNETAKIYRERFQSGEVIPATYEVIYVVARRAGT
jgi:malonyl-CoA O-methyltransferase